MSNFLKTNEHSVERVVRVALGMTLVGLTATGSIGLWGYIGVVPILTGLVGNCPIYTLAGISTCPIRKTTT